MHDTIDLMIKVFPIRTCSDASYKKAMATGRPCFPGQIGRCGGPCSMKVTIEEHRAIVDDFVAFMAGGDQRFAKELNARMREASAAMDYEAAAVYRDRLVSIDAVLSKSALVLAADTDADLFGIAEDELSAAVQQFVVRGGRVRGVRATTIEKELDISGGDLVDQVLQRAYGDAAPADIPRQVLVPALPDDAADLEEWLRERRGKQVSIQVAQRGRKAELLRTATLNAQQALMIHKTRRTSDYVARTQALTDLQEALGLAEAPLRIECFDVSHLSGTNVVASMVVFEDGLPRKDQYRSFGVPETTDDTDSLYQVLTRRLAYLDRPGAGRVRRSRREDVAQARSPYPPQLLVVDGGKPQVEAAARALRRRRSRGDRPVRHREAPRRGVDAGGGLPGDPAAHERGALPAAAAARRGAPVRDHASASPAPARHPERARRDPRARRGAHQGAAAALRLGDRAQEGDAGGDHRAARRRSEARRSDPCAPLDWVG